MAQTIITKLQNVLGSLFSKKKKKVLGALVIN